MKRTKTMLITTVILSLALTTVFAYDFAETDVLEPQSIDVPFSAEATDAGVDHEIWMEAVKMPDGMYAYRLAAYEIEDDSVTETEYKSIRRTVKEQLSSLKGFDAGQLMGIAGTVTTLAAMHLQMDTYDSSKIDNSLLRISQAEKIVSDLKKKTLSQRRKFPGCYESCFEY